jgi:arylsulfatase A-like enzyme
MLPTVSKLAALLLLLAAVGSNAEDRPNVLMIVADDLGWSDVGWHRGLAKTPRMDALVSDGVELDRHYVQPVCTPTRTALMSGRYPGRFGPHPLVPSNLRAMPLGTCTVASALQSKGYFTAMAGKWHLGGLPEWGPNQYGFMKSYGSLTGAADPWTHKYRQGPLEDTWHRNAQRIDEEGNATELVAAEAMRFIAEKREPWFVYVPFHAVHTPVDAPPEYKKLYEGVVFDKDPERQDSRLRLAAMVSQLDAKVGLFVDTLERTGQRQNTLIIFTSDNGGIESLKNAYVGDVGHSPLNSENDPLRGQKATLYEGGTRVCAFANWPAKLKPRKHTAPMHAVDWFPTIAALTGFEPKEGLQWDGLNQWPALSGTAHADTERQIYIATKSGQSLHQGQWKLIRTAKLTELFHLSEDPFEQQECAKNHPAVVSRMLEALDAQLKLDNPNLPEDLKGHHP